MTRGAATARSRRQGDRSRLRARPAHGVARAGVLARQLLARAISRRRVRRAARFVESQAAQRVQGDFRAVCGWQPIGPPIDVLTGFVDGDEKAHGRPVGVAIDKTGALLVADDVGNTVWRVDSGNGASGKPVKRSLVLLCHKFRRASELLKPTRFFAPSPL